MSKIRARHRRGRELRQLARPGRRVLPERRSDDDVPGLMHVELGGYHVGDVEFVAAFDVDAAKVGLRPRQGDLRRAEQHHQVRRRPDLGVLVQRGRRSTASASTTADASRSRRPSRSTSPRRATPRPTCWCPTCRSAPRRRSALRPGLPRRRRRLRQRHPGVHRQRPRVGGEVHRRRRADRRRRHQEPGGRHHRAPHARPPLRGPRAW